MRRSVMFAVISSVLLAGMLQAGVLCPPPLFEPDSSVVSMDSPCRGVAAEVLPGVDTLVYGSDNLTGYSDLDMDIGAAVQFTFLSPGLANIYASYLGEKTGHDVWLVINSVELQKSPGWQFMGSSSIGSVLSVWINDRSDDEWLWYLDNQQQSMVIQDTSTSSHTPEPGAFILVFAGLVYLVGRKFIKQEQAGEQTEV